MAQRKQLTQRPLEEATLLQSMQREVIPYLRQTGALVEQAVPASPPIITGSRGAGTVAVLTLVLQVLDAAGIVVDQTTP